MEANKDVCCYCEEETRYEQGYEIWKAYDGKWGHLWCVEKYNKQNFISDTLSDDQKSSMESLKETEQWLLAYDEPVDRMAAIDMFNDLRDEIKYWMDEYNRLQDEIDNQ